MRYSFHPAADRELHKAFNHYQDLGERLGYGLLDEVEEAVRFLLDYPENHLRILAVAHQSRRPFYWIGRLE